MATRVPRSLSRWLFVLVLVSCAFFIQGAGANQNSRFDLVRAIVEEHRFAIDSFAANTSDRAAWNGHAYSDKAPGLSFLAAIPWLFLRGLQAAGTIEPSPVALHVLTLCTVSLATAIAAVTWLGVLVDLGVSLSIALLAVVGWVLGTNAFAYAGIFVAHQLVASLLVLSFAWLRRKRPLAAGAASGLAVLSEFPAVFAVVFLGLYAIAMGGRRGATRFVLGGVPFAALLLAYNAACFGSPFTFGYEHLANAGFRTAIATGFFGFQPPHLGHAWALVAGEFRGFLPLSPFLVFALPGAIVVARRRRAEAIVLLLAPLVSLLLFSGYHFWGGGAGMGPRYMVGVLPFVIALAAIGMHAFVARARRLGTAIATTLVAVSIAICTATVAVQPELSDIQLTVSPAEGVGIPRLEHPLRDFVGPLFLRGVLSIKATAHGMFGLATRTRGHDLDAFNLGERVGLEGLASLLPLLAFWVVAAHHMAQRRRPIDPSIVVLAAFAYVATAARYVVAPDNGEFATLYAVGGVAHPSGYPFYVLWLRAFHWLPAINPAHGAALATVLCGVLGLVLLYRAMRAWGASRESAAIVLAAYAFSIRMWLMSTYAEVFALNATIVAAILLVARTDDARVTGLRRVALLGLLAGLGLSNHHTSVLVAPIGLWGAIRGLREARERGRARVVAVALGVAGLVLGLSPYVSTYVIARHPGGHQIWGDPSTLAKLVFHFRRGEYGTTSLTLHSKNPDHVGQVVVLAMGLLRGLFGLPLLALLGVLRARPAIEHRWARWMLLASFVATGPFFVSLFGISTEGLDRMVVERFWLLPQTVLAVLIAPYLDAVFEPLFRRRFVAPSLAAAVGVIAALFSYLDVREHHRASIELYLRNTLKIAPRHAILLGTGDHRFEGFMYTRRALGLRPDVDYVEVRLLLADWYRAQESAALGLPIAPPVNGSLSTPALVIQLLQTGRPVFLTNFVSAAIEKSFPSYPFGTLTRVLPPGTKLPDPLTVEAENLAALGQFTLEKTPPPEGTWGGDLQTGYARPWLVLAQVFAAAGMEDRAHAARERAKLLSPSPP